MGSVDEDLVVLLDDAGHPSGVAPRLTVHGRHTPLHLAFSCYLLNPEGQILVTRRALSKRTWPGVWTNACCGHPRPEEPLPQAVTRRVGQELGARVTDIRVLLPDFRYQAVDASGIRENEVCPVFAARLEGTLDPDPGEVMEHRWVDPGALAQVAATAPWLLSPWSATQIGLLDLSHLLAGTPAR